MPARSTRAASLRCAVPVPTQLTLPASLRPPWDGVFEDYKDELIREIAAEMDAQEAEEARRQAERDEKRRAAGKK